MRRNSACVKCGEIDVIHVPGVAHKGPTDSGANISLGTLHSNVHVDRYVCGNCGYVEHWLQPGDIEKLRARFQA